jgi:membrane protein DedA with SNARE-associated domain
MSQEETDVQDFLQRIARSFLAAVVWLFSNMTAGIYGGWFFFENSPRLGNYIFYSLMLLSLAALLRYLYRTWNKKFPHG